MPRHWHWRCKTNFRYRSSREAGSVQPEHGGCCEQDRVDSIGVDWLYSVDFGIQRARRRWHSKRQR